MFKIQFTDETRFGLYFLLGLLGLLLFLLILSFFLGGGEKAAVVEKEKEKVVIITQPEQKTPIQKPPPESVVSTVRDAMKKGNYSTAYMEINPVSKGSPEYEEIRKQAAEETQRRKAPGVRKEAGASPGAPLRYLDESTPRDRAKDAIYVYFVDISGALWPRFCIQAATQRPLGITGFTINADKIKIEIIAFPIKVENTEKGVAEWYDVPLDRRGYEAVKAMIKAKNVTLTVTGSRGKTTREVTDKEKKGFRNILDGYTALGGNLNYLQDNKPATSAPHKKHP